MLEIIMLQDKHMYTAANYGRSWAHIRHILIENSKNEGMDMMKDKSKFHESDLTRKAASEGVRHKMAL